MQKHLTRAALRLLLAIFAITPAGSWASAAPEPVPFNPITNPAGPEEGAFTGGDLQNGGGIPSNNFIGYLDDITPPETIIDTGPPDPHNDRSASFSFSATDDDPSAGLGTFYCRLDGSAFSVCGSGETGQAGYTDLSDGQHTFEVYACDLAATPNCDLTPASSTWQILLGYEYDFEGPHPLGYEKLLEWDGCDPVTMSTTPGGGGFLGELGNQKVCLDLRHLQPHELAKLTFDLYIIRSWNGNTSLVTLLDSPFLPSDSPLAPEFIGPDLWRLVFNKIPMLETTFSNMPAEHQAYPNGYPGGDNLRWTGAKEINSLGYRYQGEAMDAVYHMTYMVEHRLPALQVIFEASGLQNLDNESWGLDNVRLELITEPLYRVFLPVLVGD